MQRVFSSCSINRLWLQTGGFAAFLLLHCKLEHFLLVGYETFKDVYGGSTFLKLRLRVAGREGPGPVVLMVWCVRC